jgi:hypothetical protein
MRIYLSIALALTACSLPALGSATYTGSSPTGQDTSDRSAFESNSSSTVGSTLTFSNLTFDNGTWTTGTGGAVLNSGLTFIGCLTSWSDCTSGSSNASVLNGVTYPGTWDGGSDPILSGAASNGGGQLSTITISLPANVFALGLDILNLSGGTGVPFGVIVNGGSPTSNTLTPLPGSTFFGYSSATAITSFTVFGEIGSSKLGIDNIDVGSLTVGSGSSGGSGSGSGNGPSATPEASTMLLVGSGFFMLRFARKLPCFSR